jgi:hypothetical protein
MNRESADIWAVTVGESKIKSAGLGLFARKEFQPGETICEYTGRVLSLLEVIKAVDRRYIMGGFGFNTHIDAKDCPESLGRYINDPLNPEFVNARFVKLKQQRKALVVATKLIKVCSFISDRPFD